MGLDEYHRKRDFRVTAEPRGRVEPTTTGRSFVVQKHAASRLHYDFRLELDGVLKSWSIPKGPSFDPHVKRLAVAVEDHPVDYGDFEGIIPAGQYGGGTVLLWDRGTWEAIGDAQRELAAGNLKFELRGEKLKGRWALVRLKPRRGPRQRGEEDGDRSWLLIKERDGEARPEAEWDVTVARPESVVTGRQMEAIAAEADRVWHSNREGRVDPAQVTGARAAPLPASARPALPTRGRAAPAGDGWLHEVQLDGERVLGRIDAGRVRLTDGGGRDRTEALAPMAKALHALHVHDALVDGVATAMGEGGRTRADVPAELLFLQDLLHLDGHDLTRVALVERKALLERLVTAAVAGARPPSPLRYADHVVGHGEAFFTEACRLGAAGVVSKQTDAPYRGGPTRAWRVLACPAVAAGKGGGTGSGNGNGNGNGNEKGDETEGAGVAAEAPVVHRPAAKPGKRGEVRVGGVKLTHPERAPFHDPLTKVDLARYYERVAPLMLPHVQDRPLSLLRCPDGAGPSCFFVKHPGLWTPRELRRIAIPWKKKPEIFMTADDPPALVMMAQLNALEVHTWGARAARLEEPDQVVFDLDPGPRVEWTAVVDAAHLVRAALERLELRSFVKTTGGKGLHVVVPLVPAVGWDDALAFTRAVSESIARAEPRRYTTTMTKAGREDKILIDYLRNGRGATAVAVYSTRARAGAPVSVPVDWDELGPSCRSDTFRVGDAATWLARGPDPWADFFRVRQRLTAARLEEAAAPLRARAPAARR